MVDLSMNVWETISKAKEEIMGVGVEEKGKNIRDPRHS